MNANLLDEMRADAAPQADKLNAIRTEIIKLRDKEFELAELEGRVGELKADVRILKEQTLVELFDGAGINKIGIDAHGNLPPYNVEVIDRYHANIPDEREGEAFDYLRSVGSEDLIKTVFTISFGLREAEATEKFAALLEQAGVEYSAKQSVPWNTLTASFKGEYQKKPLTAKAMEVLGATVGRVAKVIKQKEGKK